MHRKSTFENLQNKGRQFHPCNVSREQKQSCSTCLPFGQNPHTWKFVIFIRFLRSSDTKYQPRVSMFPAIKAADEWNDGLGKQSPEWTVELDRHGSRFTTSRENVSLLAQPKTWFDKEQGLPEFWWLDCLLMASTRCCSTSRQSCFVRWSAISWHQNSPWCREWSKSCLTQWPRSYCAACLRDWRYWPTELKLCCMLRPCGQTKTNFQVGLTSSKKVG